MYLGYSNKVYQNQQSSLDWSVNIIDLTNSNIQTAKLFKQNTYWIITLIGTRLSK